MVQASAADHGDQAHSAEPAAQEGAAATAPVATEAAQARRGSKRPRDPDVRVQWDEENIAEHDKERGTRQKITEPPTPWARTPSPTPSELEEEGEEGSEVASGTGVLAEPTDPQDGNAATDSSGPPPCTVRSPALRSQTPPDAAVAQLGSPAGQTAQEPQQVATSPEDRRATLVFATDATPKVSSESFKAKRAAHYNEFKMLQMFRQREAADRAASDESDGKD